MGSLTPWSAMPIAIAGVISERTDAEGVPLQVQHDYVGGYLRPGG